MTLALLFTPRTNLGDPDGWIKYYKAKWDAERSRTQKPDPHKKKRKLKGKAKEELPKERVVAANPPELLKWLDAEYQKVARELNNLDRLERALRLFERQKEIEEYQLRRKALLLEMLRIERIREEDELMMMLIASI